MSMQRPVMDPMYHGEEAEADAPRKARFPIRKIAKRMLRVCRWVIVLLFTRPLSKRAGKLRVDEGPLMARIAKGVAYRLLFVPILIALCGAAFVYEGTHPSPKPIDGDPSTCGLYYDPVSFAAPDGTRLAGWLIPLVNAKTVIEQKDALLHTKHPAIVLVHDFDQSPRQMLPFLNALHEDGYVLLVVALRGTGPSAGSARTLGLRETGDVSAAVELLRRRPFVDPDRIAILGIGTGATAALRATALDEKIKATVLIDPLPDNKTLLAGRISPQTRALRWMHPVCKWTFELAYSVDADDLDFGQYDRAVGNRPKLTITATEPLDRIREPLKSALGEKD